MSNAQKITLVVATVLLVGGVGLSFTALALADFDLGNLSTTRDWVATTDTLAPESEAAHTEVVVRDGSENVRIESTPSDSIEIEYWENDSKHFEVTDEGGVLSIEGVSKPEFRIFVMDLQDRTTVIRLPDAYSGSLSVTTASGNVQIADARLEGRVTVTAQSGDVSLRGIDADSIELQTSSGRIEADDLQAEGLSASAMSGNVSINRTVATSLAANASSGDIRIADTDTVSMGVNTSSGTIDVSRCSGDIIALEASSGDITAQIKGTENEYVIATSSSSGSINAPRGALDADKHLSLATSSGSISLTLFDAAGEPSDSRGSEPRGGSDGSSPSAPSAPEAPAAPAAPTARAAA